MSAHLRGLLAKLGVRRAVLLGESMGGMVALETALAAPELVRALVLIGTGARVPVGDAQIEKLRLITEGKARRDFDRSMYGASATPDHMRRGFVEDLKTDPRVVHQNALAVRDFDRERDLARVACPTLVVVGEESTHLEPAADVLAQGIPGARRAVIPKCGGRVPLVQPDALAGAVSAFLAELPR